MKTNREKTIELLNKVSARELARENESKMIEEFLNNNEVTQLKDSDKKYEKTQTKSFTSGSITTACQNGSNAFWDEMARRRDLAYAKACLSNEIEYKDLIKVLGE